MEIQARHQEERTQWQLEKDRLLWQFEQDKQQLRWQNEREKERLLRQHAAEKANLETQVRQQLKGETRKRADALAEQKEYYNMKQVCGWVYTRLRQPSRASTIPPLFVCRSVCRLVGRSVRPSIHPFVGPCVGW